MFYRDEQRIVICLVIGGSTRFFYHQGKGFSPPLASHSNLFLSLPKFHYGFFAPGASIAL